MTPGIQPQAQHILLAVSTRSSPDEPSLVYGAFVLHTAGTGQSPIRASQRGRERIIASTDLPPLAALPRAICPARHYDLPASEALVTRGRTANPGNKAQTGSVIGLARLALEEDVEAQDIPAARVDGLSATSPRKSVACHHKRKAPHTVRNREKIFPTLPQAPERSSDQKKYC